MNDNSRTVEDFALTEKPTAEPTTLPLLVAPAPVEAKPEITLVCSESVAAPSTEQIEAVEIVKLKRKDNRASLWHPDEEQYTLIRELAELGWPSVKVAEALDVTAQQFAGAMVRYSRIKQEYETGVQSCKSFLDRRLAWRPTPADIAKVDDLASKGLREAEIAARLKVSRAAFLNRMADTPQLREAFEEGEGWYRAQLLEDSQKWLDEGGPELKNVSSLLIYKLKAHCGLTDKPEKQIIVGGKIEHTHQLKAPQTVKVDDIEAFAQQEMARAKEMSAGKLKALGINNDDIIDAEVISHG